MGGGTVDPLLCMSEQGEIENTSIQIQNGKEYITIIAGHWSPKINSVLKNYNRLPNKKLKT